MLSSVKNLAINSWIFVCFLFLNLVLLSFMNLVAINHQESSRNSVDDNIFAKYIGQI